MTFKPEPEIQVKFIFPESASLPDQIATCPLVPEPEILPCQRR